MMWTLSGFADEADENSDGQVAATQRAEFKHIDLRNVDGHNISELPLDKAEAIRKKLDAAGLSCTMFGSPIGKIDITEDFAIDEQKLRHLAELRKIFDCDKVRVFSYFNKEEKPMAEWEAEAMRRLRALRDLAGELDLFLYSENEREIFGDRIEQVCTIAELRDGIGPFRMIFDFDNFNQSDEDVWEAWEKLRNATDGFHLKDSKRDKTHVPMGTGDTHAKRILEDAVANQWAGHVAMEPHLMHSAAVMATGPGGKANEAFADMSGEDMYVAAAGYVKDLLTGVGASWN